MPRVFIPALLRELAGGRADVAVDGGTVREAIAALDRMYPGLGDRLIDRGRLRANLAIAIDGEIVGEALGERVAPATEIHFVAAIKGG